MAEAKLHEVLSKVLGSLICEHTNVVFLLWAPILVNMSIRAPRRPWGGKQKRKEQARAKIWPWDTAPTEAHRSEAHSIAQRRTASLISAAHRTAHRRTAPHTDAGSTAGIFDSRAAIFFDSKYWVLSQPLCSNLYSYLLSAENRIEGAPTCAAKFEKKSKKGLKNAHLSSLYCGCM